MAYPRYRLGRHHKFSGPTPGATLINTTGNWERLSLFEASFTDITLHKCQPNDVLQVYVTGSWHNETAQGEISAATVIGNAAVNYIPSNSATAMPCRAWRGRAGVFTDFGSFSPMYVVQPGDIHDDWNVTIRLMTNTTGAKTLSYDQRWSVQNLGPVQATL